MDIVIPWVDGSDPRHQSKRESYLPHQNDVLEEAVMPHRWRDNGELQFCLASIERHAPWVGRIFIVTDEQTPGKMGHLLWKTRRKIEIIDHTVIFHGYEDALPTFNSLSIGCVAWRIPDLSDEFILLNDDLFFAGQVQPEDFFVDGKAVLRGSWQRVEDVEDRGIHKAAQVNASRLAGYNNGEFFSPAHVAHSIRRSTMARLYEELRPEFERNIAFRFRDPSQFSASTLHAHTAIKDRWYQYAQEVDWYSLSSKNSRRPTKNAIKKKLTHLEGKKLGCVNDMAAAREAYPKIADHLHSIAGVSRLPIYIRELLSFVRLAKSRK